MPPETDSPQANSEKKAWEAQRKANCEQGVALGGKGMKEPSETEIGVYALGGVGCYDYSRVMTKGLRLRRKPPVFGGLTSHA